MEPVLAWIVASGLLMSAIAMVGSATLVLSERTLQRILLPLVAFAAGSLLGGAFFHMLPVGFGAGMSDVAVYALVLAGFAAFFALEQFLHWHHCHRADASCKKPLTYLVLIGARTPPPKRMLEGILAMEEEHADDLVGLLEELKT